MSGERYQQQIQFSIDSSVHLPCLPEKVWLSRGSLLSRKAFDLGFGVMFSVHCSQEFTRVHKLLSVQIMKAETADRAESGT